MPKFSKIQSGLFPILWVLSLVPVWAQNSMITYHNDTLRTGLNSNETLLAPSNVNSTDFGKLFTQNVDGQVYGQPLYVPNLNIAGATHNVVYIVTEHDSVYAFDADTNRPALWHVSFLNAGAGVTTVAQADVGGCPQITTEIGITDTPAIDLSSNTLYMVAMTKQVSGGTTTFYQTLHALDLSTGAEKLGSPPLSRPLWRERATEGPPTASTPAPTRCEAGWRSITGLFIPVQPPIAISTPGAPTTGG